MAEDISVRFSSGRYQHSYSPYIASGMVELDKLLIRASGAKVAMLGKIEDEPNIFNDTMIRENLRESFRNYRPTRQRRFKI